MGRKRRRFTDAIRFYIRDTQILECVARSVHRSGNRHREISIGDKLYAHDGETEAGMVTGVRSPIRWEPEVWLYELRYRPNLSLQHPVGSFVIYRNESGNIEPTVRRQSLAASKPVVPVELTGPEQGNGAAKAPVKRKKTTGRGASKTASELVPTG